jgi:peptidoglycan hydrolase CwlO-like protein
MILKNIKKFFIFTTILIIFLRFSSLTFSQTQTPIPTPDNSQAISDLQSKINDLQNKISTLQGQEKTLSSQITVMDSQIKLTEYKIQATEEQITSITLDIDTASKKIASLQSALTNSITVLLNRIVATYEVGTIQPIQVLLTSGNATDFLQRLNYLKRAQMHDKQLIYDTQQAKVDYANQKTIFENEKKRIETLQVQLQDYTNQLDEQKKEKQTLLSQTQGSEANYQSLLAQAKAQLAGFSGFAQSQGGASLLGNQTVCDDWGCYYNQRDSQWGGNSLNGTQYSLASDGCLITSMAMVYTHYGHKSVNPQTINSDSWNFASYYPAYLNFTIRADGVTSSRAGAAIDGELQPGRPVVVGIRYSNGDTHFVVLTDYNGGNYLMNDPFTSNGHRIPFTSKYSLGSIFAVYKITGF